MFISWEWGFNNYPTDKIYCQTRITLTRYPIMTVTQSSPSPESIVVLNALRAAVAKELDKKKRLGHYYVGWQDNRPIFIGDDAPESLHPKA
jgi:hypothetical protein